MPDSLGPRHRPWSRLVLALFLMGVALLGMADLLSDPVGQVFGWHGVVDVALVAVAAGTAVVLVRAWRDADTLLSRTRTELETQRRDRDAWRERAQSTLSGLGEAIDRQFDAWALTPVEKDTALLLLKGFSHKEIAGLRERSERTVRQQAVSVYRKAGLSGRAELAAFFFEDMLLPTAPGRSGARADLGE